MWSTRPRMPFPATRTTTRSSNCTKQNGTGEHPVPFFHVFKRNERKERMKKLIALLLAAVVCLSLAACDNGKTEDHADNSQGQNTENTSNENKQTETASQGNGNTEQLTDERYQEGTDPADIDKKYVGVRKRGEADFFRFPSEIPCKITSRSTASAGPRKPCRGGLRHGPSRGRYRGWHPGCTSSPAWPARTCRR